MSCSETENTENEEKSSKSKKVHIKKRSEVEQMKREDLHGYIEKLHRLIRQHEKKLKKYKEKIRKLRHNENKEEDREASRKTPSEEINSVATPEQRSPSPEKETNNTEFSASDAFSFVDEMRQAAQNAQNISNFIYEPTSGLYYDQKSGYYYNAEYGLYYDGNTGCYYSYNQDKNCYEFHSQVQVQATAKTSKDGRSDDDNDIDEVVFDEHGVVTDPEKLKKLREEREREKEEKEEKKLKKKAYKDREDSSYKSSKHTKHKRFRKERSNSDTEDPNDVEDGEISTSSSGSSPRSSDSADEDEKRKVPVFKGSGRFQDIAKKYPPSLRIVVQETNLENLKVGSLSLITYKGGSLGREGNHDVIIPDVNVSKFHLKFIYDTKKSVYKCTDLGSRNGTILNGARMSTSKTESESQRLVHGSVLQIGQTKLLCHIHEGNSTCGLCEPGLLIETQRETASAASVSLSHKEQLKKLQKKYGLENEKFTDGQQNSGGGGYQDRAATRRLKVGSSSDKEKTQTASVNTAISSENKGFKMLSKLGWNKGESLGKSQGSGALLEPINVESNVGTKGLGCGDPTAGLAITSSEKRKLHLMQKTKERYEKADIFNVSGDEN